MLARQKRLSPLPENVLNVSASGRQWLGVHVEVTTFRCAGRVCHPLCHETDTRLSVVLEESGSPCEPRRREDQPCPIGHVPRHMSFAPAGMALWGYSADTRFVKDATLVFDPPALGDRLAAQWRAETIATPRLRFADDRIWQLVKLLAGAVDDPDPATQLYGDGLVAAISARLFAPSGAGDNDRGTGPGLPAWQLRRVVEHLEAHLPERVELAQLARIAGLSPAHFSRAFKASTGMAPYRWQLDARIRRAQRLLIDTRVTLEQVAEATGFADAVHLGHTFRRLVGTSPAAWRHDRKN